jgi:hypothetical protein
LFLGFGLEELRINQALDRLLEQMDALLVQLVEGECGRLLRVP